MRHVFAVPFALALALAHLAGCGEEEVNSAGSVGWRLDFADWTCAASDTGAGCDEQFRGCDNQPSPPSTPAYSAISKVRVVVKDIEGQVRGIDEEFDCSRGIGGERAPLLGLTPRIYSLNIEAKTAAGTIFYRYDQEELDLSTKVDQTYDMQAMVGELDFYATFGGTPTGECPGNVTTLNWSLFEMDAGVPAATAAKTGSQSCSGADGAHLVLREIPVNPQPGVNDNWINSTFQLVLEGRDASGTTYCKVSSRQVRPGNNSLLNNEAMVPAASCP